MRWSLFGFGGCFIVGFNIYGFCFDAGFTLLWFTDGGLWVDGL